MYRYLVVERRGERGVGGAVQGPVIHGQEREEDQRLAVVIGDVVCIDR